MFRNSQLGLGFFRFSSPNIIIIPTFYYWLFIQVPDRGGRPYEQEPPPPEMPSWQQRNTGGPSGSGGGPRNNTYSRGNSGRPFNGELLSSF